MSGEDAAMTAARWQQLKSILADALEHPEAASRTEFVARACGDDAELLRDVQSFLAQQTDGLEKFANQSNGFADEAAGATNAGRRIGAYELLRELGRGGMGTVWLARRADDRFQQQVAIKLLKRGTDTEEVLRRFRVERQILARLEHPGIARLFDAGESDDGLPFFVMEYVAGGEPLTSFARQHLLSLSERLELFRKVCAAVQFAHQNLVVHRDLKPGNILVTPQGEPKLLDFGIARLLDPEERGTAVEATVPESRRLTPAYASPEQVRGAALTTATDIYALGALLYGLLTGQQPHQFSSEQPSPAELLRVIAEKEPRRPSLAASDPDMSRLLRGDLDTIVLRAMAHDPTRRYPSASSLASDLERYLAGRTVRARPDTFSYRSSKFISRNKAAVAGTALLLTAVLVGAATTAWEAHRAQQRFEEVRGLTDSYLFEIHDAIRDLPGSTAARQIIVTRALQYLGRLARDFGGDDSLQLQLADAYLKVGDVQGKPYAANLGDTAGALRSYARSAEIAAPLAANEHGTASAARRILSQACEGLGQVQARLQLWTQATANHRHAIALREELLRADPQHAAQWQRGLIANHIGLGDVVMSANRFDSAPGYRRAALANYRTALAIGEALVAAHRDEAANRVLLARAGSRVATELSEIGADEHDESAFREALPLHLRVLAIDEEAVRADPANAPARRILADELIALGYLRAFSGADLAAGLAGCQRARQIMENLVASDPANTEARQDLSSVHFVTARLFQTQGDRRAAAESYQRSLAILEPLVASHPDNVDTAFDLKRVHDELLAVTGSVSLEDHSAADGSD